MLAVVDTNVRVSAFLTPAGTAAKLMVAFRDARLRLVYNNAVETEYRHVLGRPKFAIDRRLLVAFLDRLRVEGRRVDGVPPVTIDLPDPDDAPFIALARHL